MIDPTQIDASDSAPYQLMPPLTPEERAALKEDIRRRGVVVAIEFDEDGTILDGHHRVQLWQELRNEGVDLPMYDSKITRNMTPDDKRNYVLALNLKRRHMSPEQKAYLFARLRQAPFNMTLQQIADVAQVGVGTVHRGLESLPADVKASLDEIVTAGKDGKLYPAKFFPFPTISISGAKAERDFTARDYVGGDETAQLSVKYLVIIECTDEEHQTVVLGHLAALGLENVKAVMS